MKFTIVTISFNQGHYLERAIQSVISQDYPDLEYIVIDSGSTDCSRDIIEKYRNKITKIIFEPDSGPADGLNKGFAYASGDIYGYLNSDDMYIDGAFSKVNNIFSLHNNIDVVSSHGFVIDKDDNVLHKVFSNKFNLIQYLAGCCVLVQQSTFFLSHFFKKSSGFNINNKIKWDGELMVDFAILGARFRLANDYWSMFRVHNESITGSKKYMEDSKKEHQRLIRKAGYNDFSVFWREIYWILSKISNPSITIRRILDGILHPKRFL